MSDAGQNGDADFAALRELLVGPERQQLHELADRVEQVAVTPQNVADLLPEAIALRSSKDRQLGRALAPTIETALRESIKRNPRDIAAAIFPVLGPAIRKAIAETMAGLVRSINSAVEHSFSAQGIKWRVEAWRTGVPFADVVIKHALVYRVEQVFLIHAETGLLLAHVAAPDLKVSDADLISGMLTAIQDFVRDSFRPAEGGTLTEFTVGELSVHVERGPLALIASVIRGEAPESLAVRAQQTLEQIHLEFAAPLADFEGDSTPFTSASPLLEENLETVLSTRSDAERGQRMWLRWAIPLAAVVLVLGALYTASLLRWRRGVRAMREEPGYLLVDQSRSWGRWHFRGLKDPLARGAGAVLLAAGLQPRAITGEWKPYISLDSAMVAQRAFQSIDSVARQLGSEQVLFGPGASAMSNEELSHVRALAAAIRALSERAAAIGARMRVHLIGRTDPTGTDATNQSLAGLRVDVVMRKLIDFGVPAKLLDGQAVATAQPLRAGDAETSARINRSVSLEVLVWNGPLTRYP